MSDKPNAFPKRLIILTVASCALVGAFFGFVAGLVAGNQPLRDKVLVSLSPSLAGYVDGLAAARRPDVAASAPAAEGTAPAAATEEDLTVAAVEKASPAVVSIVISKDVPVYEQYYANPFGDGSGGNGAPNDFFQQFFGDNPALGLPQYRQKGTEHKEIGAGSGFLVSADGTIITNKHVVADESADYTVIMQDGKKFPGKVLGRDPSNDIAVIKIEKADGKDFPFVPLGDSSKLKVGQRVIAIGYALGRFDNTASTGIVSGLDRRIQAGDGMAQAEDLFGIIQTDAAINPGNSGGPLLNLKGEAIGVDVAIVQGSQNIGFALPINDVRKVVDSVAKGGKISRPFLGVRYVMIDKDLKDKNQLPVDYGALVSRGQDGSELAVSPGSPADLAGIVENDIILEVDGKKLGDDNPLFVAIAKHDPGDKVTMKILHKGQEKTVQVTLAERK